MRLLFLLLALPVVASCASYTANIDAVADCYNDEASRSFRKFLPALADELDGNVPLFECTYDDVAEFVSTALILRYGMPEESLMHKYFVNMMLFAVGRDDNKQRTESLRMQIVLGTLVSFFNHAEMSQVPWDRVQWGDIATSAEASKGWPQDGSTLFLSKNVFRCVQPRELWPLEATLPKDLFLSVATGFEHALEAFEQRTLSPEVDARLVSLWRQVPNVQPADFIDGDAAAGFMYLQTYIGSRWRGSLTAARLRALLPLLQQ